MDHSGHAKQLLLVDSSNDFLLRLAAAAQELAPELVSHEGQQQGQEAACSRCTFSRGNLMGLDSRLQEVQGGSQAGCGVKQRSWLAISRAKKLPA